MICTVFMKVRSKVYATLIGKHMGFGFEDLRRDEEDDLKQMFSTT